MSYNISSEVKFDKNTDVKDFIKLFLGERISANGLSDKDNPNTFKFMKDLSYSLGWGYSDIEPYVNGNYAVFMNNGPWYDTFFDSNNPSVYDYISTTLNTKKSTSVPLNNTQDNHNLVKFSQLITDIEIPEPNKEYIPISTRQKNSFVNTRDFMGSDFSLNFMENKKLDVIKYHEAWHKSIELIRDGLLYVPEEENTNEYLIPNPYGNSVHVLLFEPFTFNITGLITLFGVLPINLPLKSIIGDRSGSKITTYAMNYKFMDLQYAFYDGWDAFFASAADYNQKDTKANLAHNFMKFAQILKTKGD